MPCLNLDSDLRVRNDGSIDEALQYIELATRAFITSDRHTNTMTVPAWTISGSDIVYSPGCLDSYNNE